jgi:hypothetical protein
MKTPTQRQYKATESKYKGGAEEMYVTYDVAQETRGGGRTLYPKVKRVYIAGKVKDWKVGNFAKRTGRKVHGVKIDYEQSRARYERKAYTAKRGSTQYKVSPAKVAGGASNFSKIVEVPEDAHNVRFHTGKLPRKYQDALQAVR